MPTRNNPQGSYNIRKRKAIDTNDYYPTPAWGTHALCRFLADRIDLSKKTCWEPAAGGGHMIDVLAQYFRKVKGSDIVNYEKRPDIKQDDFLKSRKKYPRAHWYITNPPFIRALEFTLRMLELSSEGVAILGRLSLLESRKRYERLFIDHPPSDILVFTERLSFSLGKVDNERATAVAFAWFIWERDSSNIRTHMHWIAPGTKDKFTEGVDDRAPYKLKPVKNLF